MEVATPSSPPPMDFDFNTARSTGYVLSAPSTPKRFGELYYYSPTAELHFSGDQLEDLTFAFDSSQDLETSSLSAEELFHGGQIKPQSQTLGRRSSSKKEDDEFTGGRGRERVAFASISGSGRRSSRSLSPLRVSDRLWEEDEEKINLKQVTSATETAAIKQSSSSSTKVSSSGSRKWSLKDFLLFRSASEGRASDKDPFRKYVKKKEEMTRRRSGPISAHELHYTMNKAVSNDMKKKTFLPYKQGILGRLAFNPAVNALANGFGSFPR